MEVNLRIDENPRNVVDTFCEGLGYKKSFSLRKLVDIYYADDATLAFYTVKDEENKTKTFIEIEVEENLNVTQEQAWDILRKWEKILEPLGIKPQNRIKRSLYEMYKK